SPPSPQPLSREGRGATGSQAAVGIGIAMTYLAFPFSSFGRKVPEGRSWRLRPLSPTPAPRPGLRETRRRLESGESMIRKLLSVAPRGERGYWIASCRGGRNRHDASGCSLLPLREKVPEGRKRGSVSPRRRRPAGRACAGSGGWWWACRC